MGVLGTTPWRVTLVIGTPMACSGTHAAPYASSYFRCNS